MKVGNHINHLVRSSGIRLLLATGASCLLLQSASAALLFSEGFNYTAGSTLAGNDGWINGSAPLSIGSGNLTWSNLTDLGGNMLSVTQSAASSSINNFSASPITSGTVYYSFVLSPTVLPTGNTYLSSLTLLNTAPNGSTDPLAVYVGLQSTGIYKIGVRHQGIGSGGTFAPSNPAFTLGSTNFFVVAYTFGAGANDDFVSLWVNPTPGGSMPAANVTVGAGGTDTAGIQTVGFKAQSGASEGNWVIDTLRIGDTWEAVVIPEPSTFALAGVGLGLMIAALRRRRS